MFIVTPDGRERLESRRFHTIQHHTPDERVRRESRRFQTILHHVHDVPEYLGAKYTRSSAPMLAS
jgi:hypothetical protein